MGDTYYEYKDVADMIVHELGKIDGWKIYGYSPSESDPYTDYYCPSYWRGIAEKNGYVFVFNNSSEHEAEEIRSYNKETQSVPKEIADKIEKLKAMTMERGASEQEEQSAKAMIEKLMQKKSTVEENNKSNYVVTGVIPAHHENPPRCNWHIEKDGVIIDKGNGVLKFSSVHEYYHWTWYEEDRALYIKDKAEYKKNYIHTQMMKWNESRESAEKSYESHIKSFEKKMDLCDAFDKFIHKIDSTCGAMIGEGDSVVYEKVNVTEYKKENKAFEISNGSITEGQCFMLKANFNYGCSKGLVYRIHESKIGGHTSYKLNGKLTKECTGMADASNRFYINPERFMKWIEKGHIVWVEIKEVKTSYTVEKMVKKVIKAEKPEDKSTSTGEERKNETACGSNNLTFTVKEDEDTRTHDKIWCVKVEEKLSKEDYIKVHSYIKSCGGYYSKFKHAFLFKEEPKELEFAI